MKNKKRFHLRSYYLEIEVFRLMSQAIQQKLYIEMLLCRGYRIRYENERHKFNQMIIIAIGLRGFISSDFGCQKLELRYPHCQFSELDNQQKLQLLPLPSSLNFGKSFKESLCGLQNIGNSCYLNSAIQALRSIEEIRAYQFPINLQSSDDDQNLNCLSELFALIQRMSGCQSPFENPSEFKRALGRIEAKFSDFEQHDSGNAMAVIIEIMRDAGLKELSALFRHENRTQTNMTLSQHTSEKKIEYFLAFPRGRE
jgi:ubiquitin C-terminal hydrolase